MKKQFLIPFLALLFFGCKTTDFLVEKYTNPQVLPIETSCPAEITWEKVQDGIEKTEFVIKSENIRWACVKIDLHTPNISIKASPETNQLGKRFIHKKFAQETNSTVALNTVPFDLDGRTYIPVSVVKINNQIVCPINSHYAALGFIKNPDNTYTAIIMKNQTEEEVSKCEFAFGGFYEILNHKTIYQFEKYKRSRTAVGISHNGRFLYCFATAGIACPTGRNGLNFEECALILQHLGCTQAMEFDGGHSTGLVLNKKNLIRPNLQRKVPALVGFEFSKTE